jgi:phosphatidylserine decarboxylase
MYGANKGPNREKRLRQLPVAKEGLLLITLSLVLSILLFLLDLAIIACPVFAFFLFCLFFFRNPGRIHSSNENELISPADGKVTEIKEMTEGEFIKSVSTRISIFMSPADVHVNRAPCEGKVLKVQHVRGDFAVAFKKDIDKENERNYILLEHGEEQILLVQIAGFLARRITCYVKPGDSINKGDAVGIIAFGSRVDIYFPKGYNVAVSLHDKVKAGKTILARQ